MFDFAGCLRKCICPTCYYH